MADADLQAPRRSTREPPTTRDVREPLRPSVHAPRRARPTQRRHAPGDRLAGTGDRHRPEWPIGLAGIRTRRPSLAGAATTTVRAFGADATTRTGSRREISAAAARSGA